MAKRSTIRWIIWVCVAIPSLAQIAFPQIYDALHRDAEAILTRHQWWRLITSIMVQDGGLIGTASNLVILGLALILSMHLWGSRATIVTFVVAGVGLNVLAVRFGASDGGGNSGATFPLLASLPPYALAALPVGERTRAAIGCVVMAASSIVLLATGDGHSIAVGLGLVLGLVGMTFARRRSRRIAK